MSEKIYLEKEFRDYCEKANIKNISDYVNYVMNSEKIIKSDLYDKIEKILDESDIESLENLKIQATELIIISNQTSYKQYRAGFNKYLEFIEEKLKLKFDTNALSKNEEKNTENEDTDAENEDIIIEETNIVDYPNDKKYQIFNSEDIKQIFKFRLITQNRFRKNNISLPISFIKQILYAKGEKLWFDLQIKRQIENIKYFSQEKENVLLNFSKLELRDNEVFIDDQNVNSYDYQNKENVKLIVSSLREISIDHCPPMAEILEKIEIEKFPVILQLSNELRKNMNTPRTYNKYIKKGTLLSKNEKFMSTINVEDLKNELQMINKKMTLQLMHIKHNNHKRARKQ